VVYIFDKSRKIALEIWLKEGIKNHPIKFAIDLWRRLPENIPQREKKMGNTA
jgi:hypothetical protein